MKKIFKWIAIGALFLIPIFPLVVANSFFFPFITGKAFYFRILVELAFAAWAILAFYDMRYRPKFTPLTIGVTIFAVVTLVADLLGVNAIRSIFSNFERMEGWLVIIHLWAFYMVSTHIFGTGEEGRKMWHYWFGISICVATVVSLYAFVQLAGHAAIHQGSRVDASLGNAAYLAVYMLMHTGLAAYLFFVNKAQQGWKILTVIYGITAVIFGFLVFATATRGTILGLIGAIMLACFIYAVAGKGQSKKARLASGGIIALIIFIGIVFWANRDIAFVQNNETLRRLAAISLSNTSGQARQYIWPMAVSGALERPIFGWGQENFNYIFNANYEPRMWSQEQWFDRAHSVYLDWFVASGFVGLASYLALYVLFILAIWRHTSLTVAEKSVLTGLIAGYAVHNIFVFDNIASYVFFFALLGFAGSLSGSRNSMKSLGKIQTRIDRKSFSNDAVEYVVAPIVLVLLFSGLYFLNIRPIQANTRLIDALISCSSSTGAADPAYFERALEIDSPPANQEIREQILSCSGNILSNPYPNELKQEFFTLAQQAIDAQISETPDDARIYVLGGAFMSGVNQPQEALELLEKAHELSPTKQSVSFQLASLYLNMDKKDEAVQLLKEAYEGDPTYPVAQSAYVTGLILTGREAEARSIFGTTTPELFESAQVARAYASLEQYTKAIALYQKLIAADPTNVELKAQLAQAQYQAGMTWAAVQTLQGIVKDHPELKEQAEAMIQQIQAGN